MKGINRYNVSGRKGFLARVLVSASAIIPLFMFFATASTPASAAGGGNDRGSVSVSADDGHAPSGGVINYTVTVVNGDQAGLYTLTDNLPNNTTLLSAPYNCTESNGRLDCALALFPNDVVTVQFSVQVDLGARCGTTLRNTARVRSWPSAVTETEVFCP